jgi:hypothetical protein
MVFPTVENGYKTATVFWDDELQRRSLGPGLSQNQRLSYHQETSKQVWIRKWI